MAAAYAALVSVMQIVHQIEISLDKEQAESLTELVSFLQEFLHGYTSPFADADEADPLEMRIADVAYAAEDVIESNIVDRILPRGSENQRNKMEWFNCFRSPKTMVKKEKSVLWTCTKVCAEGDRQERSDGVCCREKEEGCSQRSAAETSLTRLDNSSRPSLTRLGSTDMVGRDDVCLEIMDKLTRGRRGRQLIPIVGMGGIGSDLSSLRLSKTSASSYSFCLREASEVRTRRFLCKNMHKNMDMAKNEERPEIKNRPLKWLIVRLFEFSIVPLRKLQPSSSPNHFLEISSIFLLSFICMIVLDTSGANGDPL